MKIIPVIHHKNEILTMHNAEMCAKHKVYGIYIISMNGDNEGLPALARRVKLAFPTLMVGINLLGYSALDSIYESLNYSLDMTWSDCPVISGDNITDEAHIIQEEISTTQHLFFNSVAFKYQKIEKNIPQAVLNSQLLHFIPTTSGEATGHAADLNKIILMKQHLINYPLAIASGLTPDNVVQYKPYIEYGLVATGISEDFYSFDELKLHHIMTNAC